MRTTIRLDEQLLKELRQLAAQSGRTLTSLIEDAIRESLSRRKRAVRKSPVRLVTFRGRGLHAGVDLDDSASLLDLMEKDHEAGRR